MRLPLVSALAALGTATLALVVWSLAVRDLDVRGAPWRITAGPILAGQPVGQGFTAVRDGLERVEVAVADVSDQPADEVELVLRAEGPEGEELRRVRAVRIDREARNAWLVFEFEPVPDSGGRRLHVELGPAPDVEVCHHAPFVRFRGADDWGEPWGASEFSGPVVEGGFISYFSMLRGLAFGGEHLGGPAELVLLDENDVEVRRARLAERPAAEWGWLVFGFEEIEDSRWRTWRYRIELPEGGVLRGSDQEPSRVGYYGEGNADVHLHGMTLGDERFEDRDLGLRTFSARGPGVAWNLLRERLGAKGLAGLALLGLAAGLLGAALQHSAARSPRP